MTEPVAAHEPVFAFQPGERAALSEELRAHAAALAKLVIAIDGPAASGKSTTARAVASRLGLLYLDTGAMYRALTLVAQRAGVDADDGAGLVALLRGHRIHFEARGEAPRVLVDAEDVSAAVRTPAVTAAVSRVAAHPEVRREMVQRQRQIGAGGGVVLDGRDIGSVVFPDADVKVFVTAAAATRAARRQREDAGRGSEQSLAAIEADLRRRDAEDSGRTVSPLVRAPGAVWLDTTGLDFESQVDAVLALAVRAARATPALDAAQPAAARPTQSAPPLVQLVEVDLDTVRQPGYRAWHSHLYRWVHATLAAIARVVFARRVHMHPAARLPGSALVACNHVATLDPPLAGSSVPFESWYIAKLELFRGPILRRVIRRFNAIPIHRGTADFTALDRAVELLQSGRNVFMFPEGTRQKPGRLAAAKWGFGYVAANAGRPIVPVFIRGSREVRPRFLRRQPLEVWIGEPVVVRIAPGADPHAVHRQVGDLVMERIAGLMLRSAGGHPLPGLDLPGAWEGAPTVATPTSRATRALDAKSRS